MHGRSRLGIGASEAALLGLCGDRANMSRVVSCVLLLRRARGDAAATPVVADTGHVVVHDRRAIVDVVNSRNVHVGDRAVVEKVSAIPAASVIPVPGVAKSVGDSTVEPDVFAPISLVEHKGTATPPPISGGPEEAGLGRFHPGTGDPVVAAISPRPIAGSPEVAVSGARRL